MKRSPVERAAEAHTNLTTFAVVVSVLEGGHLYGNSCYETAQKIIQLCNREQSKMLRAYDAAKAEVEASHD